MKKIGVIVAMSSEFGLVETLLENKKEKDVRGFHFTEGRIGDKQIILMQSGIGKVSAAAGTVEMINNFNPDVIINTGVAGGIDPVLKVMDIVVGEEVVFHDVWCGEGNEYGQVQGMPARFKADENLVKATINLESDVNLHRGLICSGDKFITDREALDDIKGNFTEGLAVDMESGAIGQICHLYKVPFLSFRAISDTPGETENHSQQYKDFWTKAPEKSFEVLKQLIIAI